jgi:hypothetical protein
MSSDVSDCEIMCDDPAAISMMALLQPSRFIFFLLQKQFDCTWSTVAVQFSSFFNFHQHSPSRPVMTAIIFVFWTGDLGIWIESHVQGGKKVPGPPPIPSLNIHQ